MSKSEVPIEFVRALNELGLSNASSLWGTPLTGGVSSDIWRIDTEKGSVCAKRALSKLRVNADWYAPVERNLYEARWLQVAHQACPACAPELLGQHPGLGVLVMQYLEPDHYRIWKQELRAGNADSQTANAMGQVLSKIHSYAAKNSHLASEFPTDNIFFEIRLAPYLLATAERHPTLAHALEALVLQTQNNAKTLVHGDISPKNILLGPQGPLLLDAECATWSDPAFDLAFCLNHLLLKCLWTPASTADFLHCFKALTTSYLSSVGWEPPSDLEARAARLLPGLLLARVDGKSPVEYVTEEFQREHVRRVASALLIKPANHLQEIAQAWAKDLKT
jgi:aminoglycoside phosphotransferase (APT) family kinase protein